MNPYKCGRCKEFYDCDLRVLDLDKSFGERHRLPVSCKSCSYTVCHECSKDWLAKDQQGFIECPDCETLDGFDAENPNINHFACLLLSQGEQKPAAVAAKPAESHTQAPPQQKPTSVTVSRAPVASHAKPAAVSPSPKKKKNKRAHEDTSEKEEEDSYVSPPASPPPAKPAPKKKRKRKQKKQDLNITEEELEALEEYEILGDGPDTGFERYIRKVEKDSKGEPLSERNIRMIMKQVKLFCSGDGIPYKNWPEGTRFMEGDAVDLSMDFEDMHESAKAFEDEFGRDKGNGWLLKHPIKKLQNYQRWVVENVLRKGEE